MNVLITGASGFIGGFIVEEVLKKNLRPIAVVRKSSNRQYLKDERIKFVEIDFRDKNLIKENLRSAQKDFGQVDYVIHNAGVTKVLSKRDYEKVNFDFTRNFVEAIQEECPNLKKFVFISSLAASGPGRNEKQVPITIQDANNPVTEYGRSKLKTEEYLESLPGFPYVILRPPAVFGPRDTDMFSFFQLISKKIEVYIGVKTQHLSIIYVKDLAAAIVQAALTEIKRRKYFVSDNKYYTGVVFSDTIKRVMNKKTFVIKLPIFLVELVAFFSELHGKLVKRPSPLNIDKVNELKCSNWLCDSNDFYQDTGFTSNYSLESAVAETVDWYKKKKWL